MLSIVDEQTSAVWFAAGSGDIEQLRSSLRQTPNLIDLRNPACSNFTPMHNAAQHGHDQAVELLFLSGSQAHRKHSSHGWLPIHLAAQQGHAKTVETLVRLDNTAAKRATVFGWTALHLAAQNGHVQAIEVLARADPSCLDCRDFQGCMAMHLAALNGHAHVIETLVRLGSMAADYADRHGWTPIVYAAENGHCEVIKLLDQIVTSCSTRTITNEPCLQTNDLPGGQPSDSGAYASQQIAVAQEYAKMADLVIWDFKTDKKRFSFPDRTPVSGQYNVVSGQYNVFEALVRLGSKAFETPNHYGVTPLHAAASKGNGSMIKLLVRFGKDIDHLNMHGGTPLHTAAKDGHASAVVTLFRLGSKAIDSPNKYGCTPMHTAARHGRVLVIETLARLGSQAFYTLNSEGRTPSKEAAISFVNRERCVELLAALSGIVEKPRRLTDAEILQVRFRVYFSIPLVRRLLFIQVAPTEKIIDEVNFHQCNSHNWFFDSSYTIKDD